MSTDTKKRTRDIIPDSLKEKFNDLENGYNVQSKVINLDKVRLQGVFEGSIKTVSVSTQKGSTINSHKLKFFILDISPKFVPDSEPRARIIKKINPCTGSLMNCIQFYIPAYETIQITEAKNEFFKKKLEDDGLNPELLLFTVDQIKTQDVKTKTDYEKVMKKKKELDGKIRESDFIHFIKVDHDDEKNWVTLEPYSSITMATLNQNIPKSELKSHMTEVTISEVSPSRKDDRCFFNFRDVIVTNSQYTQIQKLSEKDRNRTISEVFTSNTKIFSPFEGDKKSFRSYTLPINLKPALGEDEKCLLIGSRPLKKRQDWEKLYQFGKIIMPYFHTSGEKRSNFYIYKKKDGEVEKKQKKLEFYLIVLQFTADLDALDLLRKELALEGKITEIDKNIEEVQLQIVESESKKKKTSTETNNVVGSTTDNISASNIPSNVNDTNNVNVNKLTEKETKIKDLQVNKKLLQDLLDKIKSKKEEIKKEVNEAKANVLKSELSNLYKSVNKELTDLEILQLSENIIEPHDSKIVDLIPGVTQRKIIDPRIYSKKQSILLQVILSDKECNQFLIKYPPTWENLGPILVNMIDNTIISGCVNSEKSQGMASNISYGEQSTGGVVNDTFSKMKLMNSLDDDDEDEDDENENEDTNKSKDEENKKSENKTVDEEENEQELLKKALTTDESPDLESEKLTEGLDLLKISSKKETNNYDLSKYDFSVKFNVQSILVNMKEVIEKNAPIISNKFAKELLEPLYTYVLSQKKPGEINEPSLEEDYTYVRIFDKEINELSPIINLTETKKYTAFDRLQDKQTVTRVLYSKWDYSTKELMKKPMEELEKDLIKNYDPKKPEEFFQHCQLFNIIISPDQQASK
jgi:hypothetical protein